MPRARTHPSQYDPDFWKCPFCGARNLKRYRSSYRLSRSRLFECTNPLCRQLVTETALSTASAKRQSAKIHVPSEGPAR